MIQTIHPETADQRLNRLFTRRYDGSRRGYRPGYRAGGKEYTRNGERECLRRLLKDAQQVQLLSHYPSMAQTWRGFRTTFPRHIAGLPARGVLTDEMVVAAAEAVL